MELAKRLKPAHLMLIARIAELGKLQAAAYAQGVSQPAASRILGEIEAQVGAPLFVRHPKGMTTTAVGAAFLRHARAILNEFAGLEAEVTNLTSGHFGEVCVGSVSGPAVSCVVPAIRRAKQNSPGLQATIEVGPSAKLFRGLEEGYFHFVVSRLPADYDRRDFTVIPAKSETVSLMVRGDHPLLAHRQVSLAQLSEFEWVIQDTGSPIRQAVEAAFHAGSVEVPANITNSSSLSVALAMLACSNAIAPQSREVAELLTRDTIGANLRILPLVETITVSPFFVVRHRSRQLPRAAERVLEAVLKRMNDGSPTADPTGQAAW